MSVCIPSSFSSFFFLFSFVINKYKSSIFLVFRLCSFEFWKWLIHGPITQIEVASIGSHLLQYFNSKECAYRCVCLPLSSHLLSLYTLYMYGWVWLYTCSLWKKKKKILLFGLLRLWLPINNCLIVSLLSSESDFYMPKYSLNWA